MKGAKRKTILPWILAIAIAVAGLVLLGVSRRTISADRIFRMPNHSMAPTIMKGDRVTVDLHAYSEREPDLSDLVIFRPYETGKLKWIFRIAGVPGDIIGYENGVLVRNGYPIPAPEPLQDQTYAAPGQMKAGAEIEYPCQLGPVEYFLLSDDPEHMHDSRYWGLIEREQILARVTSHE